MKTQVKIYFAMPGAYYIKKNFNSKSKYHSKIDLDKNIDKQFRSIEKTKQTDVFPEDLDNFEDKLKSIISFSKDKELVLNLYCQYKQIDKIHNLFPTTEDILFETRSFQLLDLDNVEEFITSYTEDTFPPRVYKDILTMSGGNQLLVYIMGEILKYRSHRELTKDNILKLTTVKEFFKQIAKEILTSPINDLIRQQIVNRNGTLFTSLIKSHLSEKENYDFKILFPKLTQNDRKLLTAFVRNPNTILNKENISLLLHKRLDSRSDWAIYKAVERFKKKVKKIVHIEKIKGEGWKLIPKK